MRSAPCRAQHTFSKFSTLVHSAWKGIIQSIFENPCLQAVRTDTHSVGAMLQVEEVVECSQVPNALCTLLCV